MAPLPPYTAVVVSLPRSPHLQIQTPASVEATPPADVDSTVPDLEKVIARLETEKGTLANTVKALQADLRGAAGAPV
ncbi:MAG: hypothetical protein LVS60_10600 [Nodosilinea sp. LVE1205-7]